jgi:hypothetical protein
LQGGAIALSLKPTKKERTLSDMNRFVLSLCFYNDNRMSKLSNFDSKSVICHQFSKKKTVDFRCNDCSTKA